MEHIILEQLIENEKFSRKVIPYIDQSYFDEFEDRTIFRIINAYVNRYHKIPSYNVIRVALSKSDKFSEDQFDNIMERVENIEKQGKENYNDKWLVDETEDWCKTQALENAIVSASDILNDNKKPNTAVFDLVKNALAVSFDTHMGIDFFNEKSIADRWKKYNEVTTKLATRLYKFNLVTGGGIEPKTLSCVMGDTGEGKTNCMASISADLVANGYDVLYISGEMSEEKLSQKHEANWLNVEINDITDLKFDTFKSKIMSLKQKSYGRLLIKEFPTGAFSTASIRAHLEELRIKKDFAPQIVVVDYINLLRSDRYSEGNSYTIIKAIAEELRGLAVEYEIAVLTGTQVNRGGAGTTDISMTDIAESYGLPATCDFLWAIWSTDELKEAGIQIWNPLKNRFTGIVGYKFGVNTEFSYGRVSDLSRAQSADVLIENSAKTKKQMKKFHDKMKRKRLKVNNDVKSDISVNKDEGDEDDGIDWGD
jgi:replicative DNA helicase